MIGSKIKEADFQKHLNQYNVIQLDIAEMRVTMPDSGDFVLYLQKCVINELRSLYPEILDEKVSSLPLALADIHEKKGNDL